MSSARRGKRNKSPRQPVDEPIPEPESSYSLPRLARLGDLKRLRALLEGTTRIPKRREETSEEGGLDAAGGDEGARGGRAKESKEPEFEPVPDINDKDSTQMSALAHACRADHVEIVEYLLENSADADSMGEAGLRPIHHAAVSPSDRVVKLLVNAGADVTVTDDENRTPLHYAASRGFVNAMSVLADAGADVNAVTHHGVTALHAAANNGQGSATVFLLGRGATVNGKDSGGNTALHMAAAGGFRRICRLLLEKDADKDVTNMCVMK